MDILNRILKFLYAIKNALHIYRRSAKFLAFLQAMDSISYTLCQVNTGYLTDKNVLNSETHDFKYNT